MSGFLPPVTLLIAVLVSAAMTGFVLGWLRRRGILDNPNHRSSHRLPTPRGGGLALVPVLLFAWGCLILEGAASSGGFPALLAAAGLGILSWCDDRRDLPVRVRFLGQMVAVTVGVMVMPGGGAVFQGWLPPLLDRVVVGFIWLWFTNLYNFMDGIDGITGTETAMIGAGIGLVACLGGAGALMLFYPSLLLTGLAVGFLFWNWHPARLFLGDVGSIPLGYLTGWLLLALAGAGFWVPAVILPLYYLADATLTLMRRLVRGDKIWQAHRDHYYQQATRRGRSHSTIVGWIVIADLALIFLAIMALDLPIMALFGAVVVVLILLCGMVGRIKII